MNCFDWINRSSDYLDGTLVGSAKKEADEHLDSCPRCTEHFRHYQQLVGLIASLPRKPLPIPIRKAPLSFTLPKLDFNVHKSRWDRAPWFIRTSIEGLGVAFIILIAVAIAPHARSLYEKNLEKRLDIFSSDEINDITTEPGVPLTRGKNADQKTSETSDEFTGEYTEENDETAQNDTTEITGDEVKVGNAEIWRFVLRTDSPREIRTKVVQLLTDSGINKDTQGFGGIEAPGGIQFDLIVTKGIVGNLKNNLQRLAKTPNEANNQTPFSEAFTWYKNKSKRPVPQGKARVVIWLSQT